MDKLNLKNRFDILAGFGILGIVLMIIIPLPPFMLDILLSVNIALSILILLITLFSTNDKATKGLYNITCITLP